MELYFESLKNVHIPWIVWVVLGVVVGIIVLTMMLPRLMKASVPMVAPSAVEKSRSKNGSEILIVDVRTPQEFATGYIPGAINLPVDRIAAKLATLPAAQLSELVDTPVYLVCASVMRAMGAAGIFKKAGFTRLATVGGGMKQWNKEKLPMTHDMGVPKGDDGAA